MNDKEKKKIVENFFKAWERGTTEDIRQAYDDFLSDDCVYENSGLAPLKGKAAILQFVEVGASSVGVATMQVEVKNWGYGPNTVFNERVDYHRDSTGKLTLAPLICGIMIFNGDGKITRWSDYYDPAPMLEQLKGQVPLATL